jgi:hypothetical protein
MSEPIPLVVVGLGTPAHGDAGLGAAAIDLLRRTYTIPAGVRVGDGFPWACEGPGVGLFIDAIESDAPAGAFIRLHGEEATPVVLRRLTATHGRWDPQSQLILLGLVPHTTTPGTGLSRAVEAGLAGLVRRMVLEARHLGHELRPKAGEGR